MSIFTDYSSYSYSGPSGIQSTQSVNFNISTSIGSASSSSANTKTTAIGDTASFSPEALFMLKQSQQTQQKPEKMDFENMSDDEIKSFLSEMQEKTGNLPPELGNVTSVEDMTSEEVQGVRDSLAAKQSEIAGLAPGRPAGPPPGGSPPSGAGGAGGIAGIEEDEDEETELEKLMAAMEEAQEKKLEEEKEYQKRMDVRIDPNFAGMMQRQLHSEESEAI